MKMEFLTKLTERNPEQKEKMKRLGIFEKEETRTRMLQGIAIGGFHLSIQASYYHYCQPRITLDDLELYRSMELAVIKSDGTWTNLEDDETFNDFKFIEEFKERNDTKGLYGYLDVELIEELYQYLKQKVTS